jgi:AraC-like DNA-binding protein
MSQYLDQIDWEALAVASKFKVAAFEASCPVRTRQVQRHFKATLGVSPEEFIKKIRMSIARKLIQAGQPAKVVAHELHYTDLANFCRDYRKHFGECPSGCRRIRITVAT